MEVLLKKSVRKLGQVGKVVSVKNGYGRNFLIPKGIAVRATSANKLALDEGIKELETKNIDLKITAERISSSLEAKNIVFITQASTDGRLFGSVSPKAIATKIQEMFSVEADYHNVLIDTPIKNTGIHKIKFCLHADVVNELSVVVARTEQEAQDFISLGVTTNKKSEEESDEAEV